MAKGERIKDPHPIGSNRSAEDEAYRSFQHSAGHQPGTGIDWPRQSVPFRPYCDLVLGQFSRKSVMKLI